MTYTSLNTLNPPSAAQRAVLHVVSGRTPLGDRLHLQLSSCIQQTILNICLLYAECHDFA